MCVSIHLDFSELESSRELHELLAHSFDFPDYYGKNWDAFDDCLGDVLEQSTRPTRVTCAGFALLRERLPRDADILKEVLDDLTRQSGLWSVEWDA